MLKNRRQILSRTDRANEVNKKFIIWLLVHFLLKVTRQSNNLHLPRVRTEQAKKSFYYNGCVVYNKHI